MYFWRAREVVGGGGRVIVDMSLLGRRTRRVKELLFSIRFAVSDGRDRGARRIIKTTKKPVDYGVHTTLVLFKTILSEIG